jgi:hypothetical protein
MDTHFDPLWREMLKGEHSTHTILEFNPLKEDLVDTCG